MLDFVVAPRNLRVIAALGAVVLLSLAVLAPQTTLLVIPLLVAVLAGLLFYEFPVLLAAALILAFGVALDVQVEVLRANSGGGGRSVAVLGAAMIKVVPYALTGVLLLRYGIAKAINWPFLAYTIIAGISIAVLPIGRVVDNVEMVRSYVGSVAPFVLGFALAPKSIWTALCRGVALVPLISAVGSLLTWVVGFYPAFDGSGRFQGLHSAPFLAGFCTTAIFAATLEYLRGFKVQWLIIGALDLGVLLLSQARAPFAAVVLFLGAVFLLSDRKVFPLQRKVDLVMGGSIPGMILLGPLMYIAYLRFTKPGFQGESFNLSGRDLIWPLFIDAIERRPLFGFGLGAGKLIVDPTDPRIKYLGSNAAHNEYLRLSVDAGVIGCGMIFASLIAWVVIGTRRAPPADRLVLRAALAAVLLHSGFDNTLIASTAVIQFTWFAAALARCRLEARQPAPERHHRHHFLRAEG